MAGGIRACVACSRVMRIQAHDLCHRCYRRRHHAAPRACASCGRVRRIHGHDLCSTCYDHQLAPRRIVCAACGVESDHVARGLCNRCYLRARGPRRGICGRCGRQVRHPHRGLCHACYFASRLPLKLTFSRLEAAGQHWARGFLRRLHAHARRHGYSGFAACKLARAVATTILAAGVTDARAFAAYVVRTRRDKLGRGDRQGASQRALLRFLADARLVRREPWEDLAISGRTRRLITSAPAALRTDLERYLAFLDEERRYRRATGEPVRSRGRDHRIFLVLVRWARWCDAAGLDSWQQLTPERFRALARAHGLAGKPRVVGDHLDELRRLLAFLKSERRLFSNPLASVLVPPKPRLREHVVSPEELRRWLDVLGNPQTDASVRAVGLLVVLHGLTLGELAALHLGDFKPRARLLHLTRRRLTLPVDPLTHDALVAYLRVRPSAPGNSYLFVTTKTEKSGRPASQCFFQERLRRLAIPRSLAPRHALIRDVLAREEPVVAARLFGLSTTHVHRYLCLLGGEKLLRVRSVTDRIQDSL